VAKIADSIARFACISPSEKTLGFDDGKWARKFKDFIPLGRYAKSLRHFYLVVPNIAFSAGNCKRRIAMDLLFLTIAITLYIATLGLGALCARLMEHKS
jgi:hypothetical protein